MPVFKRLVQNPSSPDKDLKVLTGSAKYKQSTFGRLADINSLAKDSNKLIINQSRINQGLFTSKDIAKQLLDNEDKRYKLEQATRPLADLLILLYHFNKKVTEEIKIDKIKIKTVNTVNISKKLI